MADVFSTVAASPFHPGETAVQTRMGVRSSIEPWAKKVVRPFMPDQHRQFYESLPFLVVAARDERGRMWSTLLCGPEGKAGFVASPTPTTLKISSQPAVGDALSSALMPGSDLGILGIEFATKRRNRVNGRITKLEHEGTRLEMEFQVDQSFGNCPQYIKPRRWYTDTSSSPDAATAPAIARALTSNAEKHPPSDNLSKSQIDFISSAETLFIASGYRGDGDDPRWGCDASHRGGPTGWVSVKDSRTLHLPDFSGNNHFNTIGNIELDDRVGITFPMFESGGLIQLSGRARIDWDEAKASAAFPGAMRTIIFSIEEVVEVRAGSLPVRWTIDQESKKRKMKVAHKVKESEDVTSFHLQPDQGENPDLWDFKPGQHLPISLDGVTGNKSKLLDRVYSLSCGPMWGLYRISVKREAHGTASQHLHDNVQVGDVLTVNQPAGDFFLDDASSTRTVVLVSAGIGVTPMLSMLHAFVLKSDTSARLVWVHGSRDGKHHPFKDEVNELVYLAKNMITKHVVYSSPKVEDSDYDSQGRVDADLLAKLVDVQNAEFYLCGPTAFMADVKSGLEEKGVDSKYVHAEAFSG